MTVRALPGRRRCRRLAILPLLGMIVLALSPALSAQALAAIPVLRGSTLDGKAIVLPDALSGRTAVLVLGFSQSARQQVADWGRHLARQYNGSPDVLYYEMPVLAGVPRLLRSWVLGRVRSSVPERAYPHFLAVPDHEDDWKRVTGYAAADDAYILVVDAHGAIRWQTHGAPSDTLFQQAVMQVAKTPRQ